MKGRPTGRLVDVPMSVREVTRRVFLVGFKLVGRERRHVSDCLVLAIHTVHDEARIGVAKHDAAKDLKELCPRDAVQVRSAWALDSACAGAFRQGCRWQLQQAQRQRDWLRG